MTSLSRYAKAVLRPWLGPTVRAKIFELAAKLQNFKDADLDIGEDLDLDGLAKELVRAAFTG